MEQGGDTRAEPVWSRRPLRFPLEPLDCFSLAIIAGCVLLLGLARHDLIPFPPDGYYHLMAARQIVEDRTIPLWDTWQLAPEGRPHLYPPLYHVLLAFLSLPFSGDVLEAFRLMLALLLPSALLSTWYLARWLYDARIAFIALLLLGWDPMFAIMGLMGLPSILSGVFLMLLLVFFLSKRFLGASAMAICALYTHTGIGPFVLLGLLLFALMRREYLRFCLALIAITLLAALPWFGRFWIYRAWLTHPINAGIYGSFGPWVRPLIKIAWLQFINLGMVVLFVCIARRVRWSETRARLLWCLLIALSPLLFTYGGRFYAHTIPVWAVLCSAPLARFAEGPIRRRAARLAAFLALCPTLVLVGFGTVVRPGPIPMVSGWMFPILVGAGGANLIDGGGKLGLVPFHEAQELARFIQATSTPDQILHFQGDRDLGVMIGFLANRRIDVGAWEEVSQPKGIAEQHAARVRDDPTGYYVSRYGLALPRRQQETVVGRFHVLNRKDAPPAKRRIDPRLSR